MYPTEVQLGGLSHFHTGVVGGKDRAADVIGRDEINLIGRAVDNGDGFLIGLQIFL